jgi:hypothetical protein
MDGVGQLLQAAALAQVKAVEGCQLTNGIRQLLQAAALARPLIASPCRHAQHKKPDMLDTSQRSRFQDRRPGAATVPINSLPIDMNSRSSLARMHAR